MKLHKWLPLVGLTAILGRQPYLELKADREFPLFRAKHVYFVI
jgi:hypothetical protein